jgi:anti-sigma28 factor (negative regulator of flagellin synthesis)
VDLSGLTGRISQTLQALAGQSAQRVGQLQKDFQAGRYQPDAGQIATAMARF